MKTPSRWAFTLLELMLVIAMIGVLFTLLAPAVNTLMRGSRLTQASDKVVAVLSLARQTALTTNHSVEVRFYQYGDPEVPGETVDHPATGKYRAIQTVETKEDGTEIKGRIEKLPLAIIIDSGSTLSPLLGDTLAKTWSDTPPPIPVVGSNYLCRAFQFLADGSTNLPSAGGALWFFTLHNLVDGDGRTTPPPNYATLKIDPVNGLLKVYRP